MSEKKSDSDKKKETRDIIRAVIGLAAFAGDVFLQSRIDSGVGDEATFTTVRIALWAIILISLAPIAFRNASIKNLWKVLKGERTTSGPRSYESLKQFETFYDEAGEEDADHQNEDKSLQ